MSRLSNNCTCRIGEFLVCAELGRKGLIATPFSSNVPKFDIIVTDEHCRTLPIQVKASNSNKYNWQTKADQWMNIEIDDKEKSQIFKGKLKIEEPNLIFVCVAIKNKPENRDRFFILQKKDIQEICVKLYCNWMDEINWKRPKSYKSLDTRYQIEDIRKYEDNWDLVIQELNKKQKTV
ncbi:MAG: hypothetical protein V2A78_03280 [bacterium]